jgi:hypothetical protein
VLALSFWIALGWSSCLVKLLKPFPDIMKVCCYMYTTKKFGDTGVSELLLMCVRFWTDGRLT